MGRSFNVIASDFHKLRWKLLESGLAGPAKQQAGFPGKDDSPRHEMRRDDRVFHFADVVSAECR